MSIFTSPTEAPGEPLSFDDLRQRLEGLARLLDATRVLATKVDLNMVLETVTHEVCQALERLTDEQVRDPAILPRFDELRRSTRDALLLLLQEVPQI